MVEGNGDGSVLRHTLRHFHEEIFHFVIHWDLKSELPDFTEFHNVTIIPRRPVYWGTDTQVLVQKQLFDTAHSLFGKASWFHLISESDVPLMTPEYFNDFFDHKEVSDVEYDGVRNQYKSRIQYFMPIRRLELRDSKLGLHIHRCVKAINILCRVNRLKELNLPVYKGSNWVSLNNEDLKKIVLFDKFHHFLNSSLADEVYVQTILGDHHLMKVNPTRKVTNDRYLVLGSRYVDWDRGNPYTFEENDVIELVDLKNTIYTFARKVKSEMVARSVIEQIK